jgi:asparagine synthase (glutamine-hydrolysing)
VQRVLGFVPSWIETFSAAATKVGHLLTDEWSDRAKSRDAYQGLLNEIDVRGQLSGRPELHQAMYLWSKTLLPNYLLCQLGDRAEMAHSVEGRVPFLDHTLVELVRSQPVDMKIRGMTEKFVLREAARDLITDTVYRRQKHPFLSPPATLDPTGRLFTYIQDKLRSTTLAAVPGFDQKKVVRLLDQLPTLTDGERSVVDQTLMALTSMCVLQDRYGLQA